VIIHCGTNVILCRYLQTPDAKKEQEKGVGGVAEIANAYLNKYDKVSNPIPEKVLT
jgi:hypothetical protein